MEFECIKNCAYINLAGINETIPWIATCVFWSHKNRLYFVSPRDTNHVQCLLKQPQIAFSIYNSMIPEGKGKEQGIFGLGYVRFMKYEQEDELIQLLDAAAKQRFPKEDKFKIIERRHLWRKLNKVVGEILISNIYTNTIEYGNDKRKFLHVPLSWDLNPFHLCGLPFQNKL